MKMKKLFLIAYFIFYAQQICAGEQVIMNLEKPFYSLHIKAEQAHGANIQVNGQSIISVDGPMLNTFIPVNHFMHDGENTLSIVNWPDDKDKNTYHNAAVVQITLQIENFADRTLPRKDIANLSFSGKSHNVMKNPAQLNTGETRLNSGDGFKTDLTQGDIVVSEAVYTGANEPYDAVSRIVTIPKTGLPQWGWLSGEALTSKNGYDIFSSASDDEYNAIHKEVFAEFEKIHRALAAKNFASIAPLFDERNKEMDQAFYREPGETARVLKRAFESTMKDPDKTLHPYKLEDTHAYIQDNNILVDLVDGGYRPAIVYIWKEGGAEFYDIFMYRKNGKWIISR